MFGTDSTESLPSPEETSTWARSDRATGKVSPGTPGLELIVIDIFQKIQEAEGAQYSYFGNYEVMAQLEAFADCHSVCLLLIHHTRKQQKISSI